MTGALLLLALAAACGSPTTAPGEIQQADARAGAGFETLPAGPVEARSPLARKAPAVDLAVQFEPLGRNLVKLTAKNEGTKTEPNAVVFFDAGTHRIVDPVPLGCTMASPWFARCNAGQLERYRSREWLLNIEPSEFWTIARIDGIEPDRNPENDTARIRVVP